MYYKEFKELLEDTQTFLEAVQGGYELRKHGLDTLVADVLHQHTINRLYDCLNKLSTVKSIEFEENDTAKIEMYEGMKKGFLKSSYR